MASIPLTGIAHGTFFAHQGSPRTGPVYSLFASGKIASLGPTLLVGGVETTGFTAASAGGGNLVFTTEVHPGNLYLRLAEQTSGSSTTAGRFVYSYTITHGSGSVSQAGGVGTLTVTLHPIKENFRGQPFSNPGFFGNATLVFQPGVPATS